MPLAVHSPSCLCFRLLSGHSPAACYCLLAAQPPLLTPPSLAPTLSRSHPGALYGGARSSRVPAAAGRYWSCFSLITGGTSLALPAPGTKLPLFAILPSPFASERERCRP